MPFGLGFGEAAVILSVVGVVYGIPLALVAWAVVTLARVRKDQEEVLRRLVALERRLTGV